ncbi:MAG: GNAT family N-acetyltransferase [bacterium]|nr:GNAT family N-acetyltransferase [bacterium]
MFDTRTGGHRAAADRVGPFATRDFLATVWRHTASPGQVPLILSDERGEVALVEEGDHLGLLGHEDLVDYRSPLGEAVDLLAEHFRASGRRRSFRFDSLPSAAADVITEALDRVGSGYGMAPHAETAVVDLPETFDQYLTAIGKKQRHEARRKRRRFVGEMGGLRLATCEEPGPVLDDFFRLHRRSAGRKGRFMTDPMEEMFTELLSGEGWRLDALYGDGDLPAAVVIGYSDADGYYLYNSAYDPDLRHVSPGVVLLTELIAATIGAGGAVFDFLKGSEPYKFRMGARARPLFAVEGIT